MYFSCDLRPIIAMSICGLNSLPQVSHDPGQPQRTPPQDQPSEGSASADPLHRTGPVRGLLHRPVSPPPGDVTGVISQETNGTKGSKPKQPGSLSGLILNPGCLMSLRRTPGIRVWPRRPPQQSLGQLYFGWQIFRTQWKVKGHPVNCVPQHCVYGPLKLKLK